MAASNVVLIPGAGGVGRAVFEQLRAQDVPVRFMVRRHDERAAELNRLGAEVVVGDLTRPETVAAALRGVTRMFFAMAVSPDHLLAGTVVANRRVAPLLNGFAPLRMNNFGSPILESLASM